MNIKEFEKAVAPLSREKYHINRTIGQDENGEFGIIEWNIFRKGMTTEEFFDPKNLAILSSKKGHTLKDIKKIVREQKC